MALSKPTGADPATAEALLRGDLQHADHALIHMGPILRHLLNNDDSSIFSDDVIARVRGMLADLARQLIHAVGVASGAVESPAWASGGGRQTDSDHAVRDELATMLSAQAPLLEHLHMLSVEWQMTERMQGYQGLDPVQSPIMQEIIGSADPDTAARGMNLLAAQARFGQSIRRMQIPLTELPHAIHQVALMVLHSHVAESPSPDSESDLAVVASAIDALRNARAMQSSRLDLLEHAVSAARTLSPEGVSLDRAGVALFLTAMAHGSGLPREAVIMSTTESQVARLVLVLRAAGLDYADIVATFAALHPDLILPAEIAALDADHAADMLARAQAGLQG